MTRPRGCAGSPGYRQGVPRRTRSWGSASLHHPPRFQLRLPLPPWLPHAVLCASVSRPSLLRCLPRLSAGRSPQLRASRGRHSQEGEGARPAPAASLPGQPHNQSPLRGSGFAPLLPVRTHLQSPLGTDSSPPPPPWWAHRLGAPQRTARARASTSGKNDVTAGPRSHMLLPGGGCIPSWTAEGVSGCLSACPVLLGQGWVEVSSRKPRSDPGRERGRENTNEAT